MSKKDKKNSSYKPLVRRFIISISLALLFGFLCSYLAWNIDPALKNSPGYWGGAFMLNIIFNRLLIGYVITLIGFMTIHPVFGFRMYPILRGAVIGIFISIGMIFYPFIINHEQATSIAWITIFSGSFYGMVIDFIATKFAGEGEDLFKGLK